MRRLWRVFGTSFLMRRADIKKNKKTFCGFPWVVTSTGPEGLWFVCVFSKQYIASRCILWRAHVKTKRDTKRRAFGIAEKNFACQKTYLSRMKPSKCRLLTCDTIAGRITPITDGTNRPTENNLFVILENHFLIVFWDVLKNILGVRNYFRTFTVNRVVWESDWRTIPSF